MLGVGVRLGDVFALDVERLEAAGHRFVEHVGDAEARHRVQRYLPVFGEDLAHIVFVDAPIIRKFVRKGTHIAGALHVVLAAQRVDAHAGAADVAGGHGQVRHRHHHRRALAVLGNA